MNGLRLAAAGLVLAACAGAPDGTGDGGGHGAHDHDLRPADLRPAGDMVMATGPTLLSQTGLYSDFGRRTLAPGIIRYTPRYELWSDGAEKERYLLLPPGQRIDTSDMDHWVFPPGTRLWKEFRVGGKAVETRLLQKVWDDTNGWYKVAYLWRADGTEAEAVPDGIVNARGTGHDVPSQDDCWRCHAGVRDVVIGVSAIQLGSAGGNGALSRLAAMGLLTQAPAAEPSPPGAGTVQAALGYLHGNCGHCHGDGSWFEHESVLRLRLRVGDRTPESTPAYLTSIGVKMFHRLPPDIDYGVVPGRPEESQLLQRMARRDEWAMPPVCTRTADSAAVALVRDWILALPR